MMDFPRIQQQERLFPVDRQCDDSITSDSCLNHFQIHLRFDRNARAI